MACRIAALVAGAVLLPGSVVFAFPVNTFTAGPQAPTSAAVDGLGNVIVVWEGDNGGDPFGIVARLYDSAGVPLGAPFQVNNLTADPQRAGAVSAALDGSFVVAWTEFGLVPPDTDGTSILARRFDNLGVPAGTAFTVNTYTAGSQSFPAVAHDAAGNFTVAWVSDEQDGDGTGVFAQRFDSAGAPIGAEFQVNTETTGNQSPNNAPAIAAAPDGTVTIVWYSAGQDDGDFSAFGGGVYAQRYDPSGTPLGTEFRVNVATAGAQGIGGIDVASDALGNFVVAWNESALEPVMIIPGRNIVFRRFDSSGTPLGGDFTINPGIGDGARHQPAIAMDGDGNFLLSYTADDKDERGIFAQSFRSDGTRIGAEFRVNVERDGDQSRNVAAGGADGHFIIAWAGDDGDETGVFARRFNTAIPSCPALPQAGCLAAGRSSLILKQSGGGKLAWNWNDGPAFDESVLGNPVAGLTSFAMCIYRENGGTDLVVDSSVPANGACTAKSCWYGTKWLDRFRYKDRVAGAIAKIRLRSGAGYGKIGVKGRGPSLGLSLPLAPFTKVTAQMINGNGDCWQAEYDTARINSAARFKANVD